MGKGKQENKNDNFSTEKFTKEQKEQIDYFFRAPLDSADRLMKNFYTDDSFYKTAAYAWVGEKDAKKLFLYGVCKEVKKVCVGLLNDTEVLKEEPSKDERTPLAKIIFGSLADVQTYRIRKMVELLSLLILFEKNTKRDEEFRIFLNAENMDLALSKQEDFREIFDKRIISN